MSEEPELELSILTARAGAGQVWAREGGVHCLGSWEAGAGRLVHVYIDLGVNQGDPCPATQAVMNLSFRAR